MIPGYGSVADEAKLQSKLLEILPTRSQFAEFIRKRDAAAIMMMEYVCNTPGRSGTNISAQ